MPVEVSYPHKTSQHCVNDEITRCVHAMRCDSTINHMHVPGNEPVDGAPGVTLQRLAAFRAFICLPNCPVLFVLSGHLGLLGDWCFVPVGLTVQLSLQ